MTNEEWSDEDSRDVREFLESLGFTVQEVGEVTEQEQKQEEEVYKSMTGHENPVRDFTVTFKFKTAGTQPDVAGFLDEIVEKLFPLGTEYEFTVEPSFIDVEDLTQRHIGASVEFTAGERLVKGKLEAVQAVGGRPYARALVVNGETWTVTYGIVKVN